MGVRFKCHCYVDAKSKASLVDPMTGDAARTERNLERIRKERSAIKARLDRIDLAVSKEEIIQISVSLDRVDSELRNCP